jgi:hypothetical protein
MLFILLSVLVVNLFDFFFASRVHFIENSSILVRRKLISPMTSDDSTLIQLQEASIELWHLSEMLNDRFAYTQLMVVTSKLAVLVIDIYWVYIRVIRSFFNMDLVRT